MQQHHQQINLQLTLLRAKLNRSTRVFSQMNPYVEIHTKHKIIKGTICNNGDKQPIWNQSIVLQCEEDEQIQLFVYDFDFYSKPELIGTTEIRPSSHLYSGKIDLFLSKQKVGQIEIQLVTNQNSIPNMYVGAVEANSYSLTNNYTGKQFQYPSQ